MQKKKKKKKKKTEHGQKFHLSSGAADHFWFNLFKSVLENKFRENRM